MEEEKNYISGKQDADIFVRQLLNIGEAMYQSGGECSCTVRKQATENKR